MSAKKTSKPKGNVNMNLPPVVYARLAELTSKDGLGKTALLTMLINAEHERRAMIADSKISVPLKSMPDCNENNDRKSRSK